VLLKPGGDPHFRVAIAGRDVNMVDAVVQQELERLIRFVLRDFRQRRRAKDGPVLSYPVRPKSCLAIMAASPIMKPNIGRDVIIDT
jgi:hypothetical protein